LKVVGSEQERKERVDEIIKDLKLSKCQNTYIGGPLIKGVSGGERKRTSIGVELITNPSLIFLDEPTTGLDSYTATQVMKILRGLANQGRTVVQTIHQPNSEIFELFDRLMLLAQGKIVFYNQKDKAIPYFSSIGFPCPDLTNPADYFMSIMSIESIEAEDFDDQDKDAVEKSQAAVNETYNKRIQHFDQSYNQSELKNDPNASDPEAKSIDSNFVQTYNLPWSSELGLLAKRNIVSQVRIPASSYMKLL
jgi:ABC-type multidrug transport system ATPase subunit